LYDISLFVLSDCYFFIFQQKIEKKIRKESNNSADNDKANIERQSQVKENNFAEKILDAEIERTIEFPH